MAQTDLTARQSAFLKAVGSEPSLVQQFYWTGGTVLAAEYLHHRISDDIDLFTESETVDLEAIVVFLKRVKKQLGYTTIDIQTSFNRNLIFLHYLTEPILKTEFTSYPFPRIEKSAHQRFKIMFDSPKDIAVNKIFTINQKPRGRDYIDLYFLMREYHYDLHDLIRLAKIKFDWHIDPIQLGSRLIEPNLVDWPKMIRPLTPATLNEWLRTLVQQLEGDVFDASV